MRKACALLIATLLVIFNGTAAAAGEAVTSGYEANAEQARKLLESAVARYRAVGDEALAEFSRQGPFTTPNHYVYVVNTRGVMLASGGPSAVFIGRDISKLLDEDLKKAFERILSQPESGALHSQEYRWMNWRDGKVERKHAYYQRVGDKIIAAGYYLPRSTPEEAMTLLADAVAAISKDPVATVSRINQLDPFFNRDDLYVFVVDPATSRFVAHGFDRRLVGTDFTQLTSVDGRGIGKEMLAALEGNDEAEVEYSWKNPVTGKQELKHTRLKRAGAYIVAVGYYR